jgi:N-acetyl sugar amidotransferase
MPNSIKHEAFYGLPNEVKFCKKCVMSNQRPASAIEFKNTIDSKKTTMNFDEDGVCDACKTSEIKDNINWGMRESELIKLLDKHRKNDGSYDCIVPGSGGKDSAFQAHVLKYKYGMNPLTITWPPILYTDYGLQNWRNWLDSGFDNISFYRNGKVMKLLTKLSIENLMHPFQTFILGQKNLAPKIASKYGINLIFYGENEAEYGNPLADNMSSLRDKSYYSFDKLDEIYLAGVSIKDLINNYDVRLSDLMAYLPPKLDDLEKANIEVHYLGYYLKWTPQEVYYYAVENTGFKARPHRTQGTYSKYSGIDDKIDDLHFYTTYIKFGIGRASYDASQEIRNKHLTREEGVALVNRFDGEFPDRYFKDVMSYLEMDSIYFHNLVDKFRSPHLWGKDIKGDWKLRHNVAGNGLDDI